MKKSNIIKVELDLYHIKKCAYTKFQVNISKQQRKFEKTETLWTDEQTDRQANSKQTKILPSKPVGE